MPGARGALAFVIALFVGSTALSDAFCGSPAVVSTPTISGARRQPRQFARRPGSHDVEVVMLSGEAVAIGVGEWLFIERARYSCCMMCSREASRPLRVSTAICCCTSSLCFSATFVVRMFVKLCPRRMRCVGRIHIITVSLCAFAGRTCSHAGHTYPLYIPAVGSALHHEAPTQLKSTAV